MRAIADEHGVFTCYANLVGTEGGKRFFGGSMIVGPAGDVRLRAPVWEEHLLIATVDLVDLVRARSDAPLLADLRTALPHVLEQLQVVRSGISTPLQYDGAEPAAADLVRGARGFPTGEFPIPVELLQPGAADGTRAAAASSEPDTAAVPARIGTTRLALREQGGPPPLRLDGPLADEWLCGTLRDECARRGYERVIVALSGGIDSAVVTYLAARALGAHNVTALRLPYRTSSPDSTAHAQLVIDALGIQSRTIDISAAVDGYLAEEPQADARRRGNVMARVRMVALFDQSMKLDALPLGTGNKTERLLGYFTWHADDTPPVNLIGDLYKTQVWALARHLGVPQVIIDKVPSADLEPGQTDEGDLGVRYAAADDILHWLLHGWSPDALIARGFLPHDVHTVHARLERTHWKRRGPSVALVSNTAIGESYLRPVDY